MPLLPAALMSDAGGELRLWMVAEMVVASCACACYHRMTIFVQFPHSKGSGTAQATKQLPMTHTQGELWRKALQGNLTRVIDTWTC